ncbi:hypothetical protein AB9E06_22255 [Rhizobium leguminosarum]|uniref:hypothetical protein n=1 Tax=Rhizobium leguminosarum TaxID=384 RepID=UPI003F9BF922
MAFLTTICCKSWAQSRPRGATYITPNVALLIGRAAGEIIGVLEIAAIALVLTSIAMLQIGRQRALKQPEQAADETAALNFCRINPQLKRRFCVKDLQRRKTRFF